MEWKSKIVDYLMQNGPKLLAAVGIIVGGLLIARWLGGIIMRWLQKRDLEPPVRLLITRIGRLLVLAFAAVIALGTIGVNIMALVTGIGVLGVGLSLATQGVLSNLVAGLLIIFTKPFRVGEYVALLGVEGRVETIELFSVMLSHPDLSRVVIPNRRIIGEILHNYGTIRQLDLAVGVAYDTDLTRALAAVREVLHQTPQVLKDPAPIVGVTMLADSSIVISLRPWVKVVDYATAGADIFKAVVERFRAQGVSIPFPQREVRVLPGSGPLAVGA
ncbi:MAG: mechanosensitive ion channel [Rubrivivax sp.]|nr:mechanosensitive ion channel [Rubrivivax sp.]